MWLALLLQIAVAGSSGDPALVGGSAGTPSVAAPAEVEPFSLEVCAIGGKGGAAVPGATVIAIAPTGAASAATAGSDGCARFLSLAAGHYKITVVAPGTVPRDLDTLVPAAGGARLKVALQLVTAAGQEMVIEARREKVGETRRVVEPEVAATVPGTQGDALKVIQDLPGLARTPFGSGGLLVRGSSPEDSRVFLDGQEIPQLYHFGGLTSVVATDVLSSIDFLPGGFGVRYGRALGGVVDVESKGARDDHWGGSLDVDVWDSEAVAQGPLGGDSRSGKLIGAVRRSYIDVILPAVVPSDQLSFTVAPRYYDYQVRWDAPVGATGTKTHLLGYGSDDAFTFVLKKPPADNAAIRGRFLFHTLFHRAQAQSVRPLSGDWLLTVSPGVGIQVITLDAGSIIAVTAERDSLGARVEARGPVGEDGVKLLVGAEATAEQFQYHIKFPEDGGSGNGISTDNLRLAKDRYGVGTGALYLEAEAPLAPGVTLVPGLRLDAYAPAAAASVDPRVAIRWETAPHRFVKGYLGLYQQPPDFQYWDPNLGNPHLRVQKAIQTGAGGGVPLGEDTTLEGELFYKWLTDLVVQKPTDPSDPNPKPGYSNEGIGRAYGLEMLLKRDLTEKLYGWVAYTLSKSERADPYTPGGWHPFDYDQTHILTIVAGWKLPRDWEAGARFRYTTGNPNTPVAAAIFDSDQNSYAPLPGAPNSGRLPPFHQLDLRFDKHWHFQRWSLDSYLDVQNVYVRQNPEGVRYNFDYSKQLYVTGLPLIPSIGIKGEF